MPTYPLRSIINGTRGIVAGGHYLAADAGAGIMRNGGNAVDAVAAMGFCLNILEPHQNGLGGEVPVILYSAKEKKAHVISGQGWIAAKFTIDYCRDHEIDLIPGDGYLPACVPAIVDTWAVAVERFGTMSFSEILAPAIELAEKGFPVYEDLHNFLKIQESRIKELYPSTFQIFYPGNTIPEIGQIIKNPDFAKTLKLMCEAEDSAKEKGRSEGIRAARDVFYKGEIADKIIEFISNNPVKDASGQSHAGLLSLDDFAEWHAEIEEPISIKYRGLDVHKCSSWTQGPVFLQQLKLLEGFDLKELGHSSPEYIHTIVECGKLAFADRETFYGDPKFDKVPLDVLLSSKYADKRRDRISGEASMTLIPGDPGTKLPEYNLLDVRRDNRRALGFNPFVNSGADIKADRDTTHLESVDSDGNMVAAVTSGGWIHSSPVIPGLGFALGTRGQMFYLNSDRPNALEPHKRPRTTLTPTLVTKNGAPYMAFGIRGGDSQDQWTLQFFLNFVDFKMDLQQALDAPHMHIEHMPGSFYPRTAFPGKVNLDMRIPPEVVKDLEKRGHIVNRMDYRLRGMCVMQVPLTGKLSGAVCSESEYGKVEGW
jgi:gamma-glutamyltranspeptidase / glutathione hydrolase